MALSELPDPLWTAEQVAEYFKVDKATVIRWIKEDGLEGQKINNRWRVLQSEVHKYRDRKFAEGRN